MPEITVLLNPKQRQQHIRKLLELDGFPEIEEDPVGVFCGMSLTSAPIALKDVLDKRQRQLISVLEQAGLTTYSPDRAPYTPDLNLVSQPQEIYRVDSQGIIARRFFVGHHLTPSTGFGVELEKAKFYNRIAVVLMQKNIRVSRMQPHRVIYLVYENFEKQKVDFVEVFKFLQQFDPGVGLNGEVPVLLGFRKEGMEIVDLEEAIYEKFPQLKYHYDGQVPILKLVSENPNLLYDY